MEGCGKTSDKFIRLGTDRAGLSFHVDTVMQGMLWMFGRFHSVTNSFIIQGWRHRCHLLEKRNAFCEEKNCHLLRKETSSVELICMSDDKPSDFFFVYSRSTTTNLYCMGSAVCGSRLTDMTKLLCQIN